MLFVQVFIFVLHGCNTDRKPICQHTAHLPEGGGCASGGDIQTVVEYSVFFDVFCQLPVAVVKTVYLLLPYMKMLSRLLFSQSAHFSGI